MPIGASRGSVLYELAQNMVRDGDHTLAVALRKLAQMGYASLEQVELSSDWVLLSIPGMGVERLRAVRRLTRAEWQPPSPAALKAADRFVAAARFALRFWSQETLSSLIQCDSLLPGTNPSYESRLAMALFAKSSRLALRHCEPEELVQVIRGLSASAQGTMPLELLASAEGSKASDHECAGCHGDQIDVPLQVTGARSRSSETDHYAYPRDRRYAIVQHYRAARDRGKVRNKEAWAQEKYGISSRTLLTYEREFPEEMAPVAE
jgi:hypothetical protein